MKGFRVRSGNSLIIKLALSVVIMTLPLVVMLLYNNFYSINVVREQVAASYKNTLSLYMSQIDFSLNAVDSYLNTVAAEGLVLSSLEHAATDEEYYMAKQSLYNSLSDNKSLYPSVSGFVVYASDRGDYMNVSGVRLSPLEEKDRLQQYIVDIIERQAYPLSTRAKRWQYARIGDDFYIIDLVRSGNMYLGAWLRTEDLLYPLRALKIEGGEKLLGNDHGEPITNSALVFDHGITLREEVGNYYLSGEEQRFLVVGAESSRGNFNLFALIPDNQILSNLPYLQRLVWVITCAALFFIPIGLYLMRKAMLLPLNRVLLAMKLIREGNWNTRVDMPKTSDEFILLGNSFNGMMDEIQSLRIHVYEEQLSKQREELQRLQLQLNPHFFLNALNIVYNMAKVKNFESIMQMTLSMIHYFRFLFRSNTSFVKLKDEVEHTRNYLQIQMLRFPERLTWDIDAPDYLMEIPAPPLVIQSFVENAIKHAVTMAKPIHVSVTIGVADEEDESNIKIRIADTGKGFDDSVLKELQAGRSLENDQGEHTGIWNVQRRLMLLYKEPAALRFYNDETTGGAVVEIILPAYPDTGEPTRGL
jgi:two-component system sensor histidine kinase YesM